MHLDPACISRLGHHLTIHPENGFGWVRYDAIANHYFPGQIDAIFGEPIPFVIEFLEPIYVSGDLIGGIGRNIESSHKFFAHYLFFYAWHDEVADFSTKNASFQIMICNDKPTIIPVKGKPFSSWIQVKESMLMRGFAKIFEK